MGRVCNRPVLVLSGLLLAALHATPQAYTISARPGAINYIEGNAFRNGKPISDKSLKSIFLEANDTLATGVGKAEMLLTPGVFLRLGEQSEIRLISPSLTNTQVEVSRGEVMLEATGLLKEQSIQITDRHSSITVSKNGLYRFTAGDPPRAAVLDGKATVAVGDHNIDLKKGKQVVLALNLKAEKFDRKKEDKLYAWSNVRSQYEAAATYRVAQAAYNASSGRWRGFGYNGFSGPGWYWNDLFSSWVWLPGSGTFYSPFGYGFYSPGIVMNAPVVIAPIYWNGRRDPVMAQIPLNPNNPAAVGAVTTSPWANDQARAAAARSMMESGMRTGSGAPVPNYGAASERDPSFGRDMPGQRMGGPGGMSMGNPGGPASMPANTTPSMPANTGNLGGMPGGNAGGPPPTPASGSGNPGGMPGGNAGGPPHQ